MTENDWCFQLVTVKFTQCYSWICAVPESIVMRLQCVCLCVLDVDECLEHLDSCAFRCHNTPGSFRCLCPKGFDLAADGRHCEGLITRSSKCHSTNWCRNISFLRCHVSSNKYSWRSPALCTTLSYHAANMPLTHTNTFGDSGPSVWNSLPADLRLQIQFSSLK